MKKILLSAAIITLAFVACDKDETTPVTPPVITPPMDTTTVPVDTTSNSKCTTKIYNGNARLESQFSVDTFASSGWTEVTGYLRLSNNVSDISKLTCIKKVGALQVYADSLVNLTGLNNLETCGGMAISGANILTSFKGLEKLTDCWRDVSIKNCPKLTSFNGLNNLALQNNQLIIEGNSSIKDLTGFDKIGASLRSLTIRNNSSLTSLKGLQLSNADIFMYIESNDALINLEGLEGVTKISGNVTSIANNKSLTSLKGLDNVIEIEGATIKNNDGLTDIVNTDLPKLTTVKVFQVDGNKNLTTISGLNSINSNATATLVSDGIYIKNNPLLTSITGLNGITSAKKIDIRNNVKLQQSGVTGFQKLTTINDTAVTGVTVN